MLKVFISSSMAEFKKARVKVSNVIAELPMAWKMAENEGPMDEGMRSMMKEWIHGSDIYLGIFGNKYSKPTVYEFEQAQLAGKTILLFIKELDESCSVDPEQKRFIESIKEQEVYFYNKFSDSSDLETRVKKGLMTTFTRVFNKVRNLPKYLHDAPWLLMDEHRFEFIDLTHDIEPFSLTDRFVNPVKIQRRALPGFIRRGDKQQPVFSSGIIHELPTNSGTHVDLFGHFSDEYIGVSGRRVAEYPLKAHFIGPAVVLDFSEFVSEAIGNSLTPHGALKMVDDLDSNIFNYINLCDKLEITLDVFKSVLAKTALSLDDLQHNFDFLLIHTGLDRFYEARTMPEAWAHAYHLNPYFSNEVLDMLQDLNLKGIGSDCLRLENPILNLTELFYRKDSPFGVLLKIPEILADRLKSLELIAFHRQMIQNNVIIIENLTNLAKIKNENCMFFVPPPKLNIEESDTDMIVRAFALKFHYR